MGVPDKYFVKQLCKCFQVCTSCICIVHNNHEWRMMLHGRLLCRQSNDNAVVRILTNPDPSEHFLHCVTEFSFSDGIDHRVAYGTEE